MIPSPFFSSVKPFNCTEGEVRLEGGPDQFTGLVEVCTKGTYTLVCREGFDFRDATVVCRQAGFPDRGECYKPNTPRYDCLKRTSKIVSICSWCSLVRQPVFCGHTSPAHSIPRIELHGKWVKHIFLCTRNRLLGVFWRTKQGTLYWLHYSKRIGSCLLWR